MSGITKYLSVAAFAAFAAYIGPPLAHDLKVVGVGRNVPETTIPNFLDYNKIHDTTHCEDVHHYLPANLLFASCEDEPTTRFNWFPPLHNFQPPPDGTQGSIHVIDPETMKSTRLSFENFDKTFVTHGIDVIQDANAKDAVYIFAVNHHPNPEWVKTRSEKLHKSSSQVELFRHVIGTDSVRHIRTIRHPLIETPNDIYATSPTSFYITNDHRYREGIMRTVEMLSPKIGWSNTLHVSILDSSSSNPEDGLEITRALTGIKSNNGMGHVYVNGEHTDEVVVISAEQGILYRTQPHANHTLTVTETIEMDSCLDNPSWYSDPWATAEDDASGYVLAGLARGIDLGGNAANPDAKDPPYVWLVQRAGAKKSARESSSSSIEQWNKKLIFADDGTRVRTASAAVIVGIDPALEGGRKRGWLFVTGFMTEHMIATKVDL